MRSKLFVVFVSLLLTLNLVAAEDRQDDEVALKNWPVPFDGVVRHAPATEGLRAVAAALPSTPSHFIAVTPCRLVDTRNADGPFGGPIFQAGDTRSYAIPAASLAANCSVPVAAAYSLNFTIANYSGRSNLKAYPTGTTPPLVSTLNYGSGLPLGNAAVVPADVNGSIDVAIAVTLQPGPTNVIIDINGYFAAGVVTKLTAGTGLTVTGTNDVTVGIAPNGVTATELHANAVTTGAIADGNITAVKIGTGEVVKSVKGLKDAVDIVGTGGAIVSTSGSTITVNAPSATPSGAMILGFPGDTTLVGAGYTEVGSSPIEAWKATSATNTPSARDHHTAIWTGTRMIVWGGYGPFGPLNTGAEYDPATDTWASMSTTNAPDARTGHTAVWLPLSGIMVVWGGYVAGTINGAVNTGGRYNFPAHGWIAGGTSVTGVPSVRTNHTAVWTGTYMVVWGGKTTGGVATNTGGRYDPLGDGWVGVAVTAFSPGARESHSAVWTGNRMVVWGGRYGITEYDEGSLYDPTADTWTALDNGAANRPTGRHQHTAVWTGSKMIVWGGEYGSSFRLQTGSMYDPLSNSWATMSLIGAPDARFLHTAVWTGKKMIIWGGTSDYNNGLDLNTGGEFDPDANSWTAMTTAGAPTARRDHTAIWTNSNRMIIFGGNADSFAATYLDNGAQFLLLSLYRKN